jgi:hypothetical protein
MVCKLVISSEAGLKVYRTGLYIFHLLLGNYNGSGGVVKLQNGQNLQKFALKPIF